MERDRDISWGQTSREVGGVLRFGGAKRITTLIQFGSYVATQASL
jgi:hypothetical protein